MPALNNTTPPVQASSTSAIPGTIEVAVGNSGTLTTGTASTAATTYHTDGSSAAIEG